MEAPSNTSLSPMRNSDFPADASPVRRRAARRDVLEARAAKAIVQTTANRLSDWQAELALLTAQAQHSVDWRRADPQIGMRLDRLEISAHRERDQLIRRLRSSADGTRSHSRVQDALRAIEGVLAGTQRARRILVGQAHALSGIGDLSEPLRLAAVPGTARLQAANPPDP